MVSAIRSHFRFVWLLVLEERSKTDDSLKKSTGPVTDYGATLATWMRHRAPGATATPTIFTAQDEKPSPSYIVQVC